jgi:hypothetical protein
MSLGVPSHEGIGTALELPLTLLDDVRLVLGPVVHAVVARRAIEEAHLDQGADEDAGIFLPVARDGDVLVGHAGETAVLPGLCAERPEVLDGDDAITAEAPAKLLPLGMGPPAGLDSKVRHAPELLLWPPLDVR